MTNYLYKKIRASKSWLLVFIYLAVLFKGDLQAQENFKSLTEGFVQNKGQIVNQFNQPNKEALYVLNLPSLKLVLKQNSFSYEALKFDKVPGASNSESDLDEGTETNVQFHRVDVQFIGANAKPEIISENPEKGKINYFLKGQSETPITDIQKFQKVTYRNLYPGIDLEFISKPGSDKAVEFNFILHPGSNPELIKWQYKGANSDEILNSRISLGVKFGKLNENIPSSYFKDSKKEIAIDYQKNGSVYSFKGLPATIDQTLIIDPVPTLSWSTYVGGSDEETFEGTTADASGNIYVCGKTKSSSNIASVGAYQGTYGGSGGYGNGGDMIICKFDNSGSPVWITYYGASGNESGTGIAVDKHGNVFVEGYSSSATGMATSGAFQTSRGGSNYYDAVLAKFTTNGILCWSTYYGGSGNDIGRNNCIAIDDDANIYWGGNNNTPNNTHITTAGVLQTTNGSNSAYDEPWVAKFDSSGTRIWGTYFGGGGSYHNTLYGITIDASRNVYLAIRTGNSNAPVTTGTHQTSYGGGSWDCVIAKINPSASAIIWATYYGGNNSDRPSDIILDDNDNVIVSGATNSANNIASAGAYQTVAGSTSDNDAFVVKFDQSGNRLWGTYLGGSLNDAYQSIALGNDNNIYCAGNALSTSGVTSPNTYQNTLGGGSNDALISKFNSNGGLEWSTYFGGNDNDEIWDIVAHAGNLICVGKTASTSSVALNNPYQGTYGGGNRDGLIVKLSDLEGGNNASLREFESPSGFICSGSQDIKVKVANEGLNDIDSVLVQWTLNGVAQTDVMVRGTLLPGSDSVVDLGSVNFAQNTTTEIIAWTTLPNNAADTINSNDTIMNSWKPGLNGIYTLGGVNSDFSNFSDLKDELNSYGICGPVEVHVSSGIYNERFELEEINGTSSVNEIYIIGRGKDSTILSYSSTGTSDWSVISLNGTDHIHFRDMSVENTGTSYAAGIWLTGNADSNSFRNMNILCDTSSTSTNIYGIVGSGSASGVAYGASCSSIEIDSVHFNGGSIGLVLNGGGTNSNYTSGNSVSNSQFTYQNNLAISLKGQSDIRVLNNEIEATRSLITGGISLTYSSTVTVGNNSINSEAKGIELAYINRYVYNSSQLSRIYNNMISSSSDQAALVEHSDHVKIWHNSLVSNSTTSVLALDDSKTIDFRNNHLENSSSSANSLVLDVSDINTFSEFDYNNYYYQGKLSFIGSVTYSNLPVLQIGFSQFNQNSDNRDPLFASATDLHTSINLPGIYVGIDEDIDGDIRNTTNPSLGADELNVPNNIGVSSILSPKALFCAGQQDIRVRIGNFGVNQVDSARISWSVNGVSQGTIYVGSSLSPRSTLDTTLGSVSFLNGDSKSVKVWTSYPNGVIDSLRNNDTLTQELRSGMSGTYSIGGTNPDFQSISSAIEELSTLGVCSPVLFDVRSGTYSERLVFREIMGASAINTITFEGEDISNTVITESGTSTADWATLTLDGAKHYTFKNLTIASMGSNFGIGVALTEGADSNSFVNIAIETNPTSQSWDIAGIALLSDMSDLYGSGNIPGSYNLFDSMVVKGGYYGAYLSGGGTANRISNSTFTDQYISGIYCNNQTEVKINNNNVSVLRNTGFSYSVCLSMCSDFDLSGNSILAGGEYGIYLQLGNFNGGVNNSSVYNNMVMNSLGYAFYDDGSQNYKLYHNSFRSVGNSSNIDAAVFFNGASGVDMRNNIIRNDNPYSYVLYGSASTFDSLDYNNYYSFGDFVYLGSSYASLASLKSGLPAFNSNSYSQDPRFYSLNDLHVNLKLAGTYVGIDKDIDNEARCPSSISIGADDENWGFLTPVISTSTTNFYTNYDVRFTSNLVLEPGIDFKWYVNGVYYTDSLSFSMAFNLGINEVKLVAQRCIYTDSVSLILNVQDGKPITQLAGFNPVDHPVFTSYTDLGISGTDFLGNTITNISTGNNIDTAVLGTYHLWYVVRDDYGNSDSIVRIVNVVDRVSPVLSLIGQDTVEIQVFSNINDSGIVASDNYYQTVDVQVDSSAINTSKVGIYEMTYTATDSSNNVSVITRWIKVVDSELPLIQLNGGDTITVRVNTPYIELGASVTDNYCGNNGNYSVSSYPNIYVLGEYVLTYNATDCEGNAALPVTRIVKVVDVTAPVVILNGLPIVTIQRWTDFVDPGVAISDNYYSISELQDSLIITSDLDKNTIGSYSVCYQVTDPSNNTSNQVCRVVQVVENITSVDNLNFEEIEVYPIPASSNLTIDLGTLPVSEVGVKVYDIAGKLQMNTTMNEKSLLNLDVTGLDEGIYVLIIEYNGTQKSYRIQVVN